MAPLFEAKATFKEQLETYNIYRLELEKYKAELVGSSAGQDPELPKQVILTKENGSWKTGDGFNTAFAKVLGTEIDVFNTGYGDLLGRIGVR